VHLNGHLDKMPGMALLRDLQHPSLVAHGDFDLCLVVFGSSPDSLLEGTGFEPLVPRRKKKASSGSSTPRVAHAQPIAAKPGRA